VDDTNEIVSKKVRLVTKKIRKYDENYTSLGFMYNNDNLQFDGTKAMRGIINRVVQRN